MSRNIRINHPDGNTSFGVFKEINVNLGKKRGIYTFKEGDIFLENGYHSDKKNTGYGVEHIWKKHNKEMKSLGYNTINDVPKYVADILVPGASIHSEFRSLSGYHRPTIIKSTVGLVILDYTNDPKGDFYYRVITAYKRSGAHGQKIGVL